MGSLSTCTLVICHWINDCSINWKKYKSQLHLQWLQAWLKGQRSGTLWYVKLVPAIGIRSPAKLKLQLLGKSSTGISLHGSRRDGFNWDCPQHSSCVDSSPAERTSQPWPLQWSSSCVWLTSHFPHSYLADNGTLPSKWAPQPRLPLWQSSCIRD